MLQGNFDNPYWGNWSGKNHGGEVNFIVYLTNVITHHKLSYVITIYGFGSAETYESQKIKYDPTTGINHVSTAIKKGTIYAHKSPYSRKTTGARNNQNTSSHTQGSDWSDFYRVNISYDNLSNALANVSGFTSDYDQNPAYWAVDNSGIQFELEESGGKATLTGSFWDFKTYMTDQPY